MITIEPSSCDMNTAAQDVEARGGERQEHPAAVLWTGSSVSMAPSNRILPRVARN
jgi:hypothetical protein